MELIKEPVDVDFSIKSKPWTEEELTDFRKVMAAIKAKRAPKKRPVIPKRQQRM